MSIEPHCTTASLTSASTAGFVGDVGCEADPVREGFGGRLRPPEVGDHDPRSLGREAVGDGMTDPLRTACDECDLAVELTHSGSPFYWSAENGVGVRILFCWVWMSGWILPMNAFQSSRAISAARRSSRCAKLS